MRFLPVSFVVLSAVFLAACSAAPVQPELPPNPLASKVTYKGTLPCADCAGIQNTLVLYQNEKSEPSRYQLTQKYIGREAYTVVERGDWQTAESELGNIIVLSPNDPEGTYQYLQSATNALEQLGQDGKLAESGLNYTLLKSN